MPPYTGNLETRGSCVFGFDNTGVGGWCTTHRRWLCPGDESETMKHSEKDLARAKRVRDKHLARTTAIHQACTCMWPIARLRNRHGHGDGCPAIAVWQKFRDEDADARAELDG